MRKPKCRRTDRQTDETERHSLTSVVLIIQLAFTMISFVVIKQYLTVLLLTASPTPIIIHDSFLELGVFSVQIIGPLGRFFTITIWSCNDKVWQQLC